MKGRWESNINVWFLFMYSQKWNCYFQHRIIMFCLLVPTLIYLWEIYIFLGSVCQFCCREICGLILRIYKLLTDTCMNVEIGTEAMQFPEKEHINGIAVQCVDQNAVNPSQIRLYGIFLAVWSLWTDLANSWPADIRPFRVIVPVTVTTGLWILR